MPLTRSLLALGLVALAAAPAPANEIALTRDEIARMVARLGSDQYAERKRAAAELERVGGPALPELRRAAAADHDEEVRRSAAGLVGRIENGIDQLLADYRAYGLPLPPPGAPLVRHGYGGGSQEYSLGKHGNLELHSSPPFLQFAFLIDGAVAGRPLIMQQGVMVWPRDDVTIVELVDPRHLTATDLAAGGDEETFALALILHSHGWAGAKDLLAKCCERESAGPPWTMLRQLAWHFWDWQLLGKDTSAWPAAYERMKALIADEPALDTPANRRLLESLTATLKPRKRPADPVEQAIDNLVAAEAIWGDGPEGDERFNRVLGFGFDAVPALRNHLADDRLTHFRTPTYLGPGEPVPGHHYRVGDMVSALLRAVAGGNASADWPDHRRDPAAEHAAIEKWWAAARTEGEETYLFGRLNPRPPRKGESDSDYHRQLGEWPDRPQMSLLGRKYPRRLAEVYRTALEHPMSLDTWPLAVAVRTSALPAPEKVDVLALGARSKNLWRRWQALRELSELDAGRCVELLVATLDGLPPRTAESYDSRRCPEADFTVLVCSLDDPRAWQALARYARRADVGMRLAVLDQVRSPRRRGDPPGRPQLAFLASFLDDTTVRDVDSDRERFDSTCAGFHFRQLEVRDFAAMQVAELLETPARDRPACAPGPRARFRELMREKVRCRAAADMTH
jgi:hypothetical protein